MKYYSHTEFAVLKADFLEKSRETGLCLGLVMDMTTGNVTFAPRLVRSLAVILGLRRGFTEESATGRDYSDVS